MSGNAPYGGKSDPVTIHLIMSNKRVSRSDHPMSITGSGQEEIWSLLEFCRAYDPSRRPTAAQVRDMVGLAS
jgi:hypothetical protein